MQTPATRQGCRAGRSDLRIDLVVSILSDQISARCALLYYNIVPLDPSRGPHLMPRRSCNALRAAGGAVAATGWARWPVPRRRGGPSVLGGALLPICARWRGSARAACARLHDPRAAQLADEAARLSTAGWLPARWVDCGPNPPVALGELLQ